MPGKERYTTEQVISALKQSKGMVTLAADILRCSPDTVDNYCKRYATVQAAKEQERNRFVDMGEIKLMQAVQNGEPWAIAFMLKTLGKDRGYVSRVEQAGPNGDPIQHNIRFVEVIPPKNVMLLPAPHDDGAS